MVIDEVIKVNLESLYKYAARSKNVNKWSVKWTIKNLNFLRSKTDVKNRLLDSWEKERVR